MRLREALETQGGSSLGKFSARALRMIHPSPTRAQQTKGAGAVLKENIAAGNTFLVTVNGKPASMASIHKYLMKMQDGRDVYEVEKEVTLPRFEGHKLAKQVSRAAFEEIRQRYPDAPVMAITKNEKIKTKYRKLGWEELDIRQVTARFNRVEVARQHGYTDEQLRQFDEGWDREGYRLFLFDPKKMD